MMESNMTMEDSSDASVEVNLSFQFVLCKEVGEQTVTGHCVRKAPPDPGLKG